jgi:hypothetical protein
MWFSFGIGSSMLVPYVVDPLHSMPRVVCFEGACETKLDRWTWSSRDGTLHTAQLRSHQGLQGMKVRPLPAILTTLSKKAPTCLGAFRQREKFRMETTPEKETNSASLE